MGGVKRFGISQPNDCNGENYEEKAVLKNFLVKSFRGGARGRV